MGNLENIVLKLWTVEGYNLCISGMLSSQDVFLGQVAQYRKPVAKYCIPRDLSGYLECVQPPHACKWVFTTSKSCIFPHVISGTIISSMVV